jgi:hypothetical protein
MEAIKSVSIDILTEVTRSADICGKNIALELIPTIYENHILNYVSPNEQQPVVHP